VTAEVSREGAAMARIRKTTPADAGAILECLRSAFEPYRSRYTPDAYRDTTLTPETIHERLASMSVLVGTIASQVTSPGVGHLRGMAVLPAWQGTGVAAQLLTAAEGDLRDRQCSIVTLDTTEPLERATGFYKKHGYRPSGRVSEFFGMPLFEYVKVLPAPRSPRQDRPRSD
jgi:GNAT superfamily N-acetyltransferase